MKAMHSSKSRKKGDMASIPAWVEGHPDEDDMQLLGDGTRDLHKACPFQTKECLPPGWYGEPAEGSGPMTAGTKLTVREVAKAEWELLPSVAKGSWGSCAFVGLGDNTVGKGKGAEIDAHDTVIRLGQAPLGKYASDVGKKADVVIARDAGQLKEGKLRMAAVGSAPKEYAGARFYVGGSHGMRDVPVLELNRMVRGLKREGGDVTFHHQLFGRMAGMVRIRGDKRTRHSTTGMDWLMRVAAAGFCGRVDVYGMSADGGGVYWNRGEVVAKIHSPAMESWILHWVQRNRPELGICVHLD